MIFKKDDGVTEVIGFAFVLIIAIFAIVMWLLIATPIYGTNDELEHNMAVEFEFAELKDDIDTMCLSNALGIKREKVINLAPTSDKSKITVLPDFKTLQSYGTITIEGGENISGYSKLKITYKTSNMYAEDVTIVYDGGSLSVNNLNILSKISDYTVVVPNDFKAVTIGSNEAVIVEYSLIDSIASPNMYVLSIGMG